MAPKFKLFFSYLLVVGCAPVLSLIRYILQYKLQSTNKIVFNGKTRIKSHVWKCVMFTIKDVFIRSNLQAF